MKVVVTTTVNRPADEVFDFIADSANNPAWQNGMDSCVWTSQPPLGLGSTYEQRAHFMGRQILSSFKVVEFEPGRHIRIVTTGGTMPIDVTRQVAPLSGGGCEVTAIVQGGPGGPMRLLDPLMAQMVGRNVRKDYATLKALLEALPSADG